MKKIPNIGRICIFITKFNFLKMKKVVKYFLLFTGISYFVEQHKKLQKAKKEYEELKAKNEKLVKMLNCLYEFGQAITGNPVK